MRALFVIPHPREGASGRQRVFQYLPWLASHGVSSQVRPFMSKTLYRILYQPGRIPHKVALSVAAVVKRLGDIARSARADVVVIHREALPLGTPVVERVMARLCPAMVFDFDDAIYLNHASHANAWTRMFRDAGKTDAIAAVSSHVIVGNKTLEAYARRYNPRVSVIPTPVDTEWFAPRLGPADDATVTIGWIGSSTTLSYLRGLQQPLAELLRRYPQARIRVIGGGGAPLALPNVEAVPWELARERDELHRFDIGLMPMPDDEWARGKCGFKALLYMSVGIPVVASPVAVNQEIVQHGVTGYWAGGEGEWIARLSELIEDAQLRRRMGEAGRAAVEQRYSLKVHAPRLLSVLQETAGRRAGKGRGR